MRRLKLFSAIALCVLAGLTTPGRAQTDEARKELEFPGAGIALSVPEGFERRALTQPFDVMRYVLEQDGVAQVSISLSAFPVSEDVTPEMFAESKLAELRGHVAMRGFEVLKTAEMPVAGASGHAVRMSYTFGGIETTAAQVYFIREVNNSPVRICYLLTVEERDTDNRLLPIVGELVRTAKFVSLRHPGELEVPPLSEPIRRPKLGFSVRPPQGWFADTSLHGVSMGRTDYLLGGVTVPTVRVMVGTPDADITAERLASRHLAALRETAEVRNVRVEVLSEGEAELAGRPGRQFVVRQYTERPDGSSDNDPAVVIAQRTIVAEAEEPQPGVTPLRSYSIACVYRGENPDRAAEILDRIAEGFSLLADEPDDEEPEPNAEPEADDAQPAEDNG